jgi:hypothetical protein
MPETVPRPQAKLDPVPAWTVLTDAPLKGLSLAREAGVILAWDERDQLYLLDLEGRHRAVSRAAERIVAGAISDDGSLVALLGAGPRLWLLRPDLSPIAERPAPPEATSLAVDPHGRYVAVASRIGLTQFTTRHGRGAGRFETKQAIQHLAFVPNRPFLIGAATHGLLVGVDLARGGEPGRLEADVAWQEALMSNVGRLTTSGDGGMVLASCFTHGVQRFDLEGTNEGAYHLGGTPAHAVPDFAGRMIAVATLEGELAVLSPAGNVRWRSGLARPAIALEVDAAGRFLVYGHATGEVVRLDLHGPGPSGGRSRGAAGAVVATRAGSASVRSPDWALPVASSDEQAEAAVVAVLDDPPRIGLMTNTNRLQVFAAEGRALGQAPEILGIGRIVRTARGWIAAATDRQVILYDARRNAAQKLDLSLAEVTHLAIRPDSYGVAIVQERDRIGRATLAGRWVWKAELDSPVEDLAIGAENFTAASTNDGRLLIFDPAGGRAATVAGDRDDPRFLIEAPESSPSPVAWLSLARRAQVLRGHDLRGAVAWESPVPWEAWQFHRVGALAVVVAPDGRALAFDGAGYLRAEGKGPDGAGDLFGPGPRGEALRLSRQGVHLICADLAGRVRWRAVADGALGPLAAGTAGVAVLIGRALTWFAAPGDVAGS